MNTYRRPEKVDVTDSITRNDFEVKYRSVGKVRSFTVLGFPLIIPVFFLLEKVFPKLSDPAVAFISFSVYLFFCALVSLSVLEKKTDIVFRMLIDRKSGDEGDS